MNTFPGDSVLGGALDGQQAGDIPAIYTRANVRLMNSARLGPITYRLRTELGSEAWHFNDTGRFSDDAAQQGYWTSSPTPPRPAPEQTYGYELPRRGNTIDQANDTGYSRIDDGDPATFWKSNPYLDSTYTHESDAQHPQWAAVDLGRRRPVNAVTLQWALPYATDFRVQYWAGPEPPWSNGQENESRLFAGPPLGRWFDFPAGQAHGHPGRQVVVLSRRPFTIRYLRVLMVSSSHTAPPGSTDVRDRLGYTLGELHAGLEHGLTSALTDWVRHSPSRHGQSIVWVSSTDPWHRASDRDPNTVQPSFERVLTTGLAPDRTMLVPLSLAYGTPQDAVNELRYLQRLHARVARAELGEEPDGQLLGPEDYAALYRQWVTRLRRTAPHTAFGGPSLATQLPDWTVPPDDSGDRSWTSRMLRSLSSHGTLPLFNFFSFEFYPFDDVCADPAALVARTPALLSGLVNREAQDGLARNIPELITEYGFSPFAAAAELGLPGAVADADIAARFLALGGRAAYIYGLEPGPPIRESHRCSTYGNLTLLSSDDSHRNLIPTAAYFTMRLLTGQWLEPGHGVHRLYAPVDLGGGRGRPPVVSAYPLRRPDGRISVLLVNRDPLYARNASLSLADEAAPLDVYTLGPGEYAWHPRGTGGFAKPDGPPAHSVSPTTTITLPPMSITVARTRNVFGRGDSG